MESERQYLAWIMTNIGVCRAEIWHGKQPVGVNVKRTTIVAIEVAQPNDLVALYDLPEGHVDIFTMEELQLQYPAPKLNIGG